jgi:hypothetical protein
MKLDPRDPLGVGELTLQVGGASSGESQFGPVELKPFLMESSACPDDVGPESWEASPDHLPAMGLKARCICFRPDFQFRVEQLE